MLQKLTLIYYGLALFAGLLSACAQEAREPVEIGAAQIELRSELVLPEPTSASTELVSEENPDQPGQSANSIPATQRIVLSEPRNDSLDRAFGRVKRYEFLPALLADSEARTSSTQDGNTDTDSWRIANKQWVQSGKGFGVAAEGMTPKGTVRLDDTLYYVPTVALKPFSKVSEHLEPMAEPFKSGKPLVFHSGATGFAHELPKEANPSRRSPDYEVQQELSPIPETQVYFSSQPKTKVTLVPAKHRLDLMSGNENLNWDRYQKLP
jgi:hypothetical protein